MSEQGSIHSDPFGYVFVTLNGIKFHYVTAGTGKPVLPLPGWPQTWWAWRSVMVRLIESGRKVIALDPRGFGDSDKPESSYSLAESAEDIHLFLHELGLLSSGGVDVVAHDLGCWIAYAHADRYQREVRSLVVSEATIPGAITLPPYPEDQAIKKTWQFGFNRLQDLPEILINGHEEDFLTWIFSNKAHEEWEIDPHTLDEYVRLLQIPGTVRATCAYYREVFSESGLEAMRGRLSRKLTLPILALGSEGGVGMAMLQSMQLAGTNVRGGQIQGAGHFCQKKPQKSLATGLLPSGTNLSGSPPSANELKNWLLRSFTPG